MEATWDDSDIEELDDESNNFIIFIASVISANSPCESVSETSISMAMAMIQTIMWTSKMNILSYLRYR